MKEEPTSNEEMEESERAKYEGLPKLEESSDEDENAPGIRREREDEDGETEKMRMMRSEMRSGRSKAKNHEEKEEPRGKRSVVRA